MSASPRLAAPGVSGIQVFQCLDPVDPSGGGTVVVPVGEPAAPGTRLAATQRCLAERVAADLHDGDG